MKVQLLSQWLLASLLVATILSPSLQTTAIREYKQDVAAHKSHHHAAHTFHHHAAHTSHHRHQDEEEDKEEEEDGVESAESERESVESIGHEKRHGHSIEHNKKRSHSHQHEAEVESALIADDEGTENGNMSVENSTLDNVDEAQVDSVQDDEIEADSVEENGDDAEVDSADDDDDNNNNSYYYNGNFDENEGVNRLSADEEPKPKWKFLANPYDYKGKNFEQRKTQFTNKAQIMQNKLKDMQDGDEKKALEEKLRFYKAKHEFWAVEDELERKKLERDQHKQLSNDWKEVNQHVNKLRMEANKHFVNLRKDDQERILAKRDHWKRNLGRGRYKQFQKDGKTAKEGSVWDKYKDHPNHPDNRNKRQEATENQQGESATEKYVNSQHYTDGNVSVPHSQHHTDVPIIRQTKTQHRIPLNLKKSTNQELAEEIQRLERLLPNKQTNSNRQQKLKRRIQYLKNHQRLRQRKTPTQPQTQAEQDDILSASGAMFQHVALPSS